MGEWVYSFPLLLLLLWRIGLISQFYDHFTGCTTPWTGDQLVARPLPKHRTSQTQNKRIHIPNIHALCGTRTYEPGFRASEDSTCLRPLGYRGRQWVYRSIFLLNTTLVGSKWSASRSRSFIPGEGVLRTHRIGG
jgi:hypothetical protein